MVTRVGGQACARAGIAANTGAANTSCRRSIFPRFTEPTIAWGKSWGKTRRHFDAIATQTVRKADHLEPAFMHHPPKKVRGVKLADKRA